MFPVRGPSMSHPSATTSPLNPRPRIITLYILETPWKRKSTVPHGDETSKCSQHGSVAAGGHASTAYMICASTYESTHR